VSPAPQIRSPQDVQQNIDDLWAEVFETEQFQTPWLALTDPQIIGSNWTSYDVQGGAWSIPCVRRDLSGMGHFNSALFKGKAAFAYNAATAVLCTLPPGYRPGSSVMGLLQSSDTVSNASLLRIDIPPSGAVTIQGPFLGTCNLTLLWGRLLVPPWYCAR
jgi:hypothetical protein